MDAYYTIARPGEAQYTEKRSRFLAFAVHAADEEAVKAYVAACRKQYYDARHVCYAYAFGPDGATFRANDDGEPSGSAGKPILGCLRSRNVTDTLVVVVRYFGGVKLGTGGLAVAYKTAAAAAIDAATIEQRLVLEAFAVRVPYADADVAMRFVRDAGAEITARDYTDTEMVLTVSARQSLVAEVRARLARIHTLTFVTA